MKWPYKKLFSKGKRRVSQKQSHRANVEREMRNESVPTRQALENQAIDRELEHHTAGES